MAPDEQGDVRVASFLIVDDDRVSVKSIRRAITRLQLANAVTDVGDGLAALDHLRSEVEANDGSLPPWIVLLDLNMPRMSGLEFLEAIRRDAVLAPLIVFVITTSDAPRDVAGAYAKNVAGYLVKHDLDGSLQRALDMVGRFARFVVLP